MEHIVIRKITPMQYILNRMQIHIANEQDQAQLLKYDRHIRPDRLLQCIRSGLVYALWDGNQIVGILRYNLFWQTIPFLDLVFIDENYRGQGWGSRMMAHWEKTMQQAGYSHVMLSTQEDETAKFFYEKIGYHRIGAFLPPDQEADEIMYLKSLDEIPEVRLVLAEARDAALVQAMQQEAFAELLEKYQDYDMSPATESPEKIRWKLSHPGSYYYFIRVGEETVGAIRIWDPQDGSRKRISPLYILPAYRGKGYAQAAMLEAERLHGSHHWQLDTILQEAGSCYLYEKMGYHQTGNKKVIQDNMTIVDYEKD